MAEIQEFNGKAVANRATKSPVERLLKRLYSSFLNSFILLSHNATAAIRTGIPLDACATSAPPHQPTEQFPRILISFSSLLSLEIAIPKNLCLITG